MVPKNVQAEALKSTDNASKKSKRQVLLRSDFTVIAWFLTVMMKHEGRILGFF
uniref:Uncharacterized protein n=1 Tax=Catagonus wagneri TaxID=51154 RepID=A0A8C3WYI8_9CETA